MRAFSSSLVLPGLLALVVAGCGGGNADVEVGVTAEPLQASSTSQGGSSTAAQRHLVVTVASASVHVDGDGDASAASHGNDGKSVHQDTGSDGGWTTIYSGSTKVDLLDATSTEELLGTSTVPAGKVTQIRLVITGAQLVDGATTSPVSCPSCTESGLKIVTAGAVEVKQGGTLHLTLDFDQAHSLTQEPSGYRLDPVIKIAKAEEH